MTSSAMPVNKIPKTDIRYEILQTIPDKEYESDHSFVYLRINDEKDYYMVSADATIQTQLLWYSQTENRVVRLWANEYIIPTTESQVYGAYGMSKPHINVTDDYYAYYLLDSLSDYKDEYSSDEDEIRRR